MIPGLSRTKSVKSVTLIDYSSKSINVTDLENLKFDLQHFATPNRNTAVRHVDGSAIRIESN